MSTIESETIAPPQATPKRDWLPSQPGEPTWELALTYPRQGSWTLDEYLKLDTGRLVEFKDGVLEFLPVPSQLHEIIAGFLYSALKAFVLLRRLGAVYSTPMPVITATNRVRQPDVTFLPRERMNAESPCAEGAALVMEVISPGLANRNRDEVEKRAAYAEAGIAEYWLVDPEFELIRVLVLNSAGQYEEIGCFGRGSAAASKTLDGFSVSVDAVFDEFENQAAEPR